MKRKKGINPEMKFQRALTQNCIRVPRYHQVVYLQYRYSYEYEIYAAGSIIKCTFALLYSLYTT